MKCGSIGTQALHQASAGWQGRGRTGDRAEADVLVPTNQTLGILLCWDRLKPGPFLTTWGNSPTCYPPPTLPHHHHCN